MQPKLHHQLPISVRLSLIAIVVFVNSVSADQAPVAIQWALLDRSITLHEPVILRLTVQNLAGAALASVDLGQNEKSGLLFTITPLGGTAHKISPLEFSGTSAPGNILLAPGVNYTEDFTVNEWYPFERPGEYEIQVRLRYPVMLEGHPIEVENDTRLLVRVEERDEIALERRCSSLTERILQSSDSKEAAQIATALSSVRDEIAVPFLITALSSKHYLAQDIIVRTLGRIPTPASVEALARVARAPGPYRDRANQLLRLMKENVGDAKLQQALERALESLPDR